MYFERQTTPSSRRHSPIVASSGSGDLPFVVDCCRRQYYDAYVSGVCFVEFRLLTAIQEAEREREGGGSGGSYLLGNEVMAMSHFSHSLSTWKHLHTIPARPHTRAASQAPANSDHEYAEKYKFTPVNAREPTAQRLARKAKSTMRAAGAAVSKLWSAAGKVLADEEHLFDE